MLVKPLAETDWDEFQRLVDVNLGGTSSRCKHVIPVMERQGGGVIVNLGSVSGHVGQVDHSLYGATKGAVIALGRALAWELAPLGIRVASVSPGSVDTAMLRGDIELEAEANRRLVRGGQEACARASRRSGAGPSRRRSPRPSTSSRAAAHRSSPAPTSLVDCGWVAR